MVSFYLDEDQSQGEQNVLFVLILWWVFAYVIDILMSLKLVLMNLCFFFVRDNIVYVVSMLLSVLLRFNMCAKEHKELEASISMCRWSILKMDQIQKTWTCSYPLGSHSKTAEIASSKLEIFCNQKLKGGTW